MKILIVDDRETNLKLLRLICGAEGFETIEARDGAEALEVLKKTAPDAIISDILMPNMDGYSFCRAVRADLKLSHIPFIIYTSTYVSPGDEELALKCGADKYLKKPAPAAEIIAALRETTARKRAQKIEAVELTSEGDILRQYSETLIRKLEEKNQELQEQNEKLAKTEDQLRQSQKLESIGQLAGGIAHDFNNILTAILGHAEFLEADLRSAKGSLDDALEIVKAAQRAAALTRQLLAFSRRQVLEPKVIDLKELISNLDKMLRRLIGENIDLRSLPGDGVGSVKADPGQVEQVVLNLVVNARDAMPGGGRLTIETSNAELSEDYTKNQENLKPGHYVMLCVSDTGSGMDKATQARIFEPFFTTKAPGEGTGLGLSTVYGIVKQSEGHIAVYSEPGRGSTFKVYLPRVDQAVEKPAGETPPAEKTGTETILLVEDEPAVRAIARRTLSQLGYVVLEATSGQDAERIIKEGRKKISLMLTDLVMPGIDGAELARRVSALDPRLKILFMSGYTNKAAQRQNALEAGAAYLHKPFTPQTLSQKVREVLDKPLKLDLSPE